MQSREDADPVHFWRVGDSYGEFSNFSRHPVELDSETWPTSEHYYQAMKYPDDPELQLRIRLEPHPFKAKRIAWESGNQPRPDWDEVRDAVMLKALRAKFTQHPSLRQLLLNTGDRLIVERAPNDKYWGDGANGSGTNRLGELLMQVREELR